MNVKTWATDYLARGWAVVPLTPGSKVCKTPGWTNLIFQPSDFRPKDNIGIRSVQGIVILDIDCAEAVAVADAFLPPTEAVYGRASKPRSKRVYTSKFTKTVAYKDLDAGTTLLEIRAEHQDMAPPSRHPDGEVLEWDGEIGVATEVPAAQLLYASRLAASCAVVGRYYNPAGNRHEWCLALSGMLRRCGVVEDDCVTLLEMAGKWAHDSKIPDRVVEVRATYSHGDDDPFTGAPSLGELGTPKLAATLSKIWGKKSETEWHTNKSGAIQPNSQYNVQLALTKLGATLTFDEFAQKPLLKWGEYDGPLQDAICIRLWLEVDSQFHFRPSKDLFIDILQDTAHRASFHPVCEYLSSLTWDGTSRLDSWLIDAAGAGDTDYVRAVSALMLIAAVRRVRTPGCKFDEMVVLESGQQGLFKSTALRTLCPSARWFSDDLPLNVGSKEIVERTLGKWLIEASDLSGMRVSMVEQLKGMLSRQVDGPVRLAYGRLPIEQPRQFIVVGTTNSYTYLTDSTGNRRFWPVRISQFSVEWVAKNRDALWAEAAHREAAGESIRLDASLWGAAKLQQDRRKTGDPWEEKLAGHFDGDYYRVTPEHIWDVLCIPVERRDTRQARRVAETMQALGFRRMTVVDYDHDDKRVKGWGRGERLHPA
tara:strand:+ start:371 stop:2320 length:1950 start_codon:yes stop_codon:yes gene_type:complete